MSPVDDPRGYRKDSRERWGGAARGWEAQSDALRRASMPVSMQMIEAIEPQPGHRLLELAAGPGDTGFLAVELVQPGGSLVSSDFAPEMLTAAQRRADALGLRGVRFRQIDAEAEIDFPAASFDGVLCRWGYMLMADPESALRETRRVLRPGGRLALAAWTGPDDNRWSAEPSRVLIRRGLAERPDPSLPGQFAWAREGIITEQLEAVGFEDIEVEPVDFGFRWPSFEVYWAWLMDTSVGFSTVARALDAPTLDAVRADLRAALGDLTDDDGSMALPARTWVASASA